MTSSVSISLQRYSSSSGDALSMSSMSFSLAVIFTSISVYC
nr:MAG TPA: hypothetical protein [Caudoviricetes sp.]